MNRGLIPLVLLLAACAGASAADPAEAACDEIDSLDITLESSQSMTQAPGLALDRVAHARLSPDGASFVAIEATGQPLVLFAGTADLITGLLDDGTNVNLGQPAPNAFCPEDIPEHYDLDLGSGLYILTLAPSTDEDVWLLLTSAEGHTD